MPYTRTKQSVMRYRNARNAMRRRFKPRYVPRLRKGNLMGAVSGVPAQRRVTMRYNDTVNVTCTSGILSGHSFIANGIYDPDITGTGHQPMGRDTYATLYQHYVVESARISIQSFARNIDAPVIVGVYVHDQTGLGYVDSSGFIESQKGTWLCQSIHQSKNSKALRTNYNAKRFFNLKDVKDNVARIGAAIGSNPTEQSIFSLWFQTKDGSTQNQYFNVTIDYTVIFSEPKDIAQS